MGRPSEFTIELCHEICEEIAAGKSLRQCCTDRGLALGTVNGWFLDNKDGVFEHYARARKLQAELMYDEMLEITDDATNDYMEKRDRDGKQIGWEENGEWTRRSMLRVDTRKWILARMDPSRYSDKHKVEHSGEGGEPLKIVIERSPDGG